MEKKSEPFIGRLGATAITTVVGGILLGAVLNAYNAPEKQRDRFDDDRDQIRAELNEAIIEVRVSLSELREQVAFLRSGREFFHQSDWDRENRRLEERQNETLRQIEAFDERLRHLERK